MLKQEGIALTSTAPEATVTGDPIDFGGYTVLSLVFVLTAEVGAGSITPTANNALLVTGVWV